MCNNHIWPSRKVQERNRKFVIENIAALALYTNVF